LANVDFGAISFVGINHQARNSSTVRSSPDELAKDLLAVPIEPVSLVNDIAERFRQSVVNGTLKPGEEINELQLAERLGVSRGTLREAIRILIGEGLLEKLPNRTSRVRTLSPDKAWEIMTARAVIEGFAARALSQRLTSEKLEQLRGIWQHLYDAALANDHASFLHWDFGFHQAIMEMSGHEVLFETWTKISAWIRLMFASEAHNPEELVANALNHKSIIDAIATGDPDVAEEKLKTDLLDQQELRRATGLPAWFSNGRSQAKQE
jgi:DNA-binding GntR family transcriptional regulator